MKLKISFLLSIIIHITILSFILFIEVPPEEPEEEIIKINIEITSKNRDKNINNSDVEKIIEKSTDVISRNIVTETPTDTPVKNSYIDFIKVDNPELVISKKNYNASSDSSFDIPDLNDFEESLSEMIPMEDFLEEEEVNKEQFEISWDGESRDVIEQQFIDFSSFPKDSFTGVGVHVEFMVNSNGEVFGVEIKPPGSGSADFDILIKQYINKFTFKKGESTSKGEVIIVYKK
ncbi:MAG: hypothetical protein OCD02_08800 [Spirochaetaceae bacterium]